ncbi:hypothetical protein ES708_02352 [subsurface metagenome]
MPVAGAGYRTTTGDLMKRIILILLLMQTASSITHATEQYTRIGFTLVGFGSSLSLSVEHHISDMSVRMNLGTLSMEEEVFSFAMTVNGYAGFGDTRPHAGVGFLHMFGMSEKKPQTRFMLDVPMGLDCRFSNGHALDLEVDILYFTDPRKEGAPRYMPLPGLFYKFRL